ncbi:MAG: HAMP domain-containing sensor histidine kinase [Vulcanimicrobiota bacterium]
MGSVALWAVLTLVSLALGIRTGFPHPDPAVAYAGGLCLVSELAAVRLPAAGFFSTGYAVALALASQDPKYQSWAMLVFTLALLLRHLGRGATIRETLTDLAPGACALAALQIFVSWQARCLAGIIVYYLLAELCQPYMLHGRDHLKSSRYHATREWTSLYRWAVLFLAPVLVCLHLVQPVYILLGVPILAGVQRAAYSAWVRFQELDNVQLQRKEAEAKLKLAEAENELNRTTHHLRLREFSEKMLLELTRSLSLSQDVANTARVSLEMISRNVRYRQLALYVTENNRLRPLFWMGDSAQPKLPGAVEQAALAGAYVPGTLSLWPLEGEGALTVDTEGHPPLGSEQIYLVGVVASQTALGLQSARRYREQQQAQAGVMQASKMAAVGQLAAGVAHELNTPLGAVQLQLELTQMQPGLSPMANKALEVAGKAVDHAQKIISRLLYYSREGASERQVFDLGQIVSDTMQLLAHQLQIDGVQVEVQAHPGCGAAVNANEIQQVLTNLILNAKDSCLEKEARGRRILVRTITNGKESGIEVYDQGAGIPEAIRERIFEPFFTSKPVGKGVGLGLSVSMELVQQHDGRLTATPAEAPWSTVFRIILPAAH